MNIWLFNHYALPPRMPGGTRHFDISRHLVRLGHDVTIVASSFHYSQRSEFVDHVGLSPSFEEVDGVKFVWIKTLPYKKNGPKRVLNMMSYCLGLWPFLRSRVLSKPDLIVGSSPHPFTPLIAKFLAKIHKVPFVLEVRDLWPQSLIDAGISRSHPFVRLLTWIERFLYSNSEAIVTLLPNSHDFMLQRGAQSSSIHWIPNGIDLRTHHQPPPCLERQEPFRITYAGAVGHANGLEVVVEAAKILQNENFPVEFVILGNGPERDILKEQARASGLENLSFFEPVPKSELAVVLSQSDALLFHLRRMPVFRFGISPNKLFDYLASGRPVLFGCESSNNPVEEAQAGVSFQAESPESLAVAVKQLSQKPLAERQEMAERGLRFVRENHSSVSLARRFHAVIERLCN